MTLRDLQPDALAALDAAEARARVVVDPELLALAQERIDAFVSGAPLRSAPRDQREIDACAVIDQELIDVARVDDDTVRAASAHFADGGLADLVMASYILEARTRLAVAAERLLGGL